MAKDTALAQYSTFNATDYQQGRIEEEEAQGSSFESFWLKLPQGTTILRILPTPVDWEPWFKARKMAAPFVGFWEHFYQNPESGQWVNYTCPRKTVVPGQKPLQCPDCTREYLLRNESEDELDHELSKSIRAKYKIGCNVYVRSSTDPKFEGVDTVVGLKMSALSPQHRKKLREEGGLTTKTMFEKLEAAFLPSPGRRGRDVVNPTSKGYDIIVTRTGEGKNNTTYTVAVCDDPCPLHEDAKRMSEILSSQKDIREHVRPATLEEIETIANVKPTGTVKQVKPASQDISDYIATTTVDSDDELTF